METKWLWSILVLCGAVGCVGTRRELQPSLRVVEQAIQGEGSTVVAHPRGPSQARLYRARHGWWLRVEEGCGPWRLTPRAESLLLAGSENPPPRTWHPAPLPQEELPATEAPEQGGQAESPADQGSR